MCACSPGHAKSYSPLRFNNNNNNYRSYGWSNSHRNNYGNRVPPEQDKHCYGNRRNYYGPSSQIHTRGSSNGHAAACQKKPNFQLDDNGLGNHFTNMNLSNISSFTTNDGIRFVNQSSKAQQDFQIPAQSSIYAY